ncbi:MAG: hypothetical protein ACOCRX_01425 [Candidatus Woesearchaeota archaeon]
MNTKRRNKVFENAKNSIKKIEKLSQKEEEIEAKFNKLQKEKAQIDNEVQTVRKTLNTLEKQLGKFPSLDASSPNKKRGPKKGTKHYKNEVPLREAVKKVMKPGVSMSPKKIAEKVHNMGFKTKQKNEQHFRSSIGVILRQDNSIKKIKRGRYMLASKNNKNEANKKKAKKQTVAA